MIDWKILASAFIALLVVSFILLGGFGLGGLFSGGINAIGEWFGSSPFGGFLSSQETDTKSVTVRLFPSNITLKPDDEVVIEAGTMNLTGFRGHMQMDFEGNAAVLAEDNTKLKVTIPLEGVKISGLRLAKLSLSGMKFTVEPNVTTSNGTIRITGFSGSASTTADALELRGNISKLVAKIGDLEWEMT